MQVYIFIHGNTLRTDCGTDTKKQKKKFEKKREKKNEELLCCQVVHDSCTVVPLTELHLSRFNCAELLTGSRRYGHCSRGGTTLLLFGVLI